MPLLQAYNAEKAGAKAIIVTDYKDERLLTMAAPEDRPEIAKLKDDITIPTALVQLVRDPDLSCKRHRHADRFSPCCERHRALKGLPLISLSCGCHAQQTGSHLPRGPGMRRPVEELGSSRRGRCSTPHWPPAAA